MITLEKIAKQKERNKTKAYLEAGIGATGVAGGILAAQKGYKMLSVGDRGNFMSQNLESGVAKNIADGAKKIDSNEAEALKLLTDARNKTNASNSIKNKASNLISKSKKLRALGAASILLGAPLMINGVRNAIAD